MPADPTPADLPQAEQPAAESPPTVLPATRVLATGLPAPELPAAELPPAGPPTEPSFEPTPLAETRTLDGVSGSFDLDDTSASAEVAFAYVSDTAITVEWCVDNVTSDHAGAVVTFSGVVRDHDHGRGVLRLSYTGHPSADEVMRQVADDIAAAHPGTRIAVAHRIGDLAIGDIALAAAVASAHRGQAFAACAELIDAVKERVPIWKEQSFTDGTTEWVGSA